MQIIRLSTAGSVDDGKSTLIGRLLYDTKSLSKDKVENIEHLSKQRGLSDIDLSLITDGLTAEREQGITIDVAHIYFNTKNRKYIIADTPGHVEYTRNMITGASNSQVFMILIDARNGIIEQTKRHLFIAALMEIKEIVVVINKMDLVGYDESAYIKVVEGVEALKENFGLNDKNLTFIPISAKVGDNVVTRSDKMDWYNGTTLLDFLENVKVEKSVNKEARFNVQYVIRPHSDEFHDFRGYAGRLKSGTLSVGDEITVLSSGQQSKIKSILKYKEPLLKAKPGDSVTIELEDDIDISRGDIITKLEEKIEGVKQISSRLCWLSKDELSLSKRYLLQYGSSRTPVKITRVKSQLDFDSLQFKASLKEVSVNTINEIELKSAAPLFIDKYLENTANGYFILIDEGTNSTIGVGFRN